MDEVYFQSEFQGGEKPGEQGKPGVKVIVGKEFSREGKYWKIPAVYLFDEGIVMDLCCRVAPDALKKYYSERKRFSRQGWTDPETFEYFEGENPWPRSYCVCLTVNGKDLRQEGSSSEIWMPENTAGEKEAAAGLQDCEIRRILDAYQCDREYAWYFSRCRFRWAEGEAGETPETLRTVTAEFAAEPRKVPGFCFVTREGEAPKCIPFHCPLNREEGVLKIRECFSRKLDEEVFRGIPSLRKRAGGQEPETADVEFPLYQTVISWNTEPEGLRSVCSVTDCCPSGGHPRRKRKEDSGQKTDRGTTEVIGASAVCVSYSGGENRETSWSASALTFEKQAETRWQADFFCDDGDHLLVEVIK